jgi:hypothetical protein
LSRYLLFFGIALIIITGCTKDLNPLRHTIIDWVGFVKLNGNTYEEMYNGVISDPDLVTERVVGVIKFKVDGNVTNPRYSIKNGDAGFLEKGTKLYAIEGLNEEVYIAGVDKNRINGYKVYYNDKDRKGWHFKDLDQQKIISIEIHKGREGENLLVKHEGSAVKSFLNLLNNSIGTNNYQPETKNGDPKSYRMVLFDGGPVAQIHHIFRDDNHYYWSPWDTNILDGAIEDFLELKEN